MHHLCSVKKLFCKDILVGFNMHLEYFYIHTTHNRLNWIAVA